MSRQAQHLGGRLGPKLADLMARGATQHLQQSADVRAKVHKAGLDAFWHGVGREYRAAFGAHLKSLADHPDTPDTVKPLLSFVARQPGEGAALLGTLWYGTGLGQTFGAILSNLLAPVIHSDLASNPNALLPPDLLAQLAARQIYTYEQASSEARGAAVADWRFQKMVAGAHAYPDLITVLELWRRRIIDRDRAVQYMRLNGYSDPAISDLLTLIAVPLAPADLADMTLRGIIDQTEGRARALESGVPEADFDLLAEAVGEPPGPEQLSEMLRRGFIDRARFDRGIRQGRTRNEWTDYIYRASFQPMSTADAVSGVVQGHLTDAQGQQIAHLNGLEPEYWAPLVETAGEPIARGEALELFNRGEMSEAEVTQAVRESRVKNKYIPDIIKLRRRLPPERSIVSMLAHGAITHQRAAQLLAELGFSAEDAAALIKAGAAQRTTGTKHLAVGTIAELAAEHAISETDALDTLHALGWSDHDARLELTVAKLRREHAWRQSAATRVGTDYVNRLIDKNTLITYLDHIGLPVEQRDAYLTLWDIERSARVKRLTEAQVVSAVKHGVLQDADGHARLVALGYSDQDAHVLLATAGLE